ncbi:hypothetical protein [Rhizobium mongolense]|uniref:Membrane protein YkvI n=2 Tax=Rhizobium mongolense TaxID=57676 RepID=A0ABR6IN69_9HYPH|nr:hypothetical protein [Rhizobium mongolense]MBB4229329.1 hypothetical protein [Rhizobium mongolense]TVZ63125.1 hypothetical protein BCL32_3246 [Rhizobium mongolense USDA 1844]
MSALLSSVQFWVGAVLLMCFQIGKYGELNDQDDDLKPWFGAIPNLRVRHFLGFQKYLATLLLFLGVTFLGYGVACLVSPSIISGWLRVTTDTTAADKAKAYIDSVPYPLFIAAAFMGLTNQSIPGFSKIANLQRDIFHELVGVPRIVANTATDLSVQLWVKFPTDADRLAAIELWASPRWETSIRDIADLSFYDAELKRRTSSLVNIQSKSASEALALFRELIYVMAIAAVRKNGGAALRSLAAKLGVNLPQKPNPFKGLILAGLISVVILSMLCFAVPMLGPVVDVLNGQQPLKFWPQGNEALRASSIYLASQCFPVLLASTLLFLFFQPERMDAGIGSSVRSLIEKHAGKLALIMLLVLLFDYAQLISDYGIYSPEITTSPTKFFALWFPYNVTHSIISVSICVVLLHYVGHGQAKTPGVSTAYILAMIAVAASTACFYAVVRLRYDWKVDFAADYVLMICLLNVVAAMIALFISQSLYYGRIVKHEDRLPEAAEHLPKPAGAIAITPPDP